MAHYKSSTTRCLSHRHLCHDGPQDLSSRYLPDTFQIGLEGHGQHHYSSTKITEMSYPPTRERRQQPPTPPASPHPLSRLDGDDLIGREVLVRWDDDVWYDALVVTYYPVPDEYKLVYRADDAIEVSKLCDLRWMLAPKKKARPNNPVLEGAIIEFEYPTDGKRYKAMIYNYTHGGERLKIAYIDDHTTDALKGGGWDFLTDSPCCARSDREDEDNDDSPAPRRRDRHHSRAHSDKEDEDNDILVPPRRDRAGPADSHETTQDNSNPTLSRHHHRQGRTHDVGVRKVRMPPRQRRGL